jgi:F0F1-type ATP synthase membrane subunit b/b'
VKSGGLSGSRMDGLLKQLGIDITVLYQFLVFSVGYLVLANVLFKKVLFVLKTRDDKTTKLEANANEDFEKAEKLATEYKEKIDQAYTEAQAEFNSVKNDALNKQKDKITAEEKKLAEMIESETKVFVEETNKSKDKVLSQADDLTKNLVEKLVR